MLFLKLLSLSFQQGTFLTLRYTPHIKIALLMNLVQNPLRHSFCLGWWASFLLNKSYGIARLKILSDWCQVFLKEVTWASFFSLFLLTKHLCMLSRLWSTIYMTITVCILDLEAATHFIVNDELEHTCTHIHQRKLPQLNIDYEWWNWTKNLKQHDITEY